MGRSYAMLCPISRALDRVGDRWTLLILRDLHAGPMRFGEIRSGLPGLATNLLTTRLGTLVDNGLLRREGQIYTLTDVGRSTRDVLWELARLGMGFPPEAELKRPGHLRLVAVTLESAMRRVLPPGVELVAELVLDGESFAIRAEDGDVTVRYGAPEDAAVVAISSYDPMMQAAAGVVDLDAFRAAHVQVSGKPEAIELFAMLLGRTMMESFGGRQSD
jgi:DNA-binding HxlR family transcriptional regulator